MAIYDNILIIGCGLIGSSMARAARDFGLAKTIGMADASADVVATVKGLGLADSVSTDAPSLADNADMVMLCMPVGSMGAVAKAIVPKMKTGAVLSDVGSVKSAVVAAITPHLRRDIDFVPGHPIAGTENSGPESGFSTLFKSRFCILTPENDTSAGALSLKAFWEGMGSEVAFMDAARHDTVLATTSHLPHLLAFTLVGTAMDMERVTDNDVVKYSAGGFRDFTRIAASDPVMWRDIFLANKDAVLDVVDRYIEDLSAIKRAIRWDEADALEERFAKTRNIRRYIVDAGQDTDAPNFGRDKPKT